MADADVFAGIQNDAVIVVVPLVAAPDGHPFDHGTFGFEKIQCPCARIGEPQISNGDLGAAHPAQQEWRSLYRRASIYSWRHSWKAISQVEIASCGVVLLKCATRW